MAAVSLKDLMNPLTKIEEHSKATSEKLDKIEELLVRGVSGSSSGGGVDISALVTGQNVMIELQSTMLTQLDAQTEYLKIIAEGGETGILDKIFGGGDSGGDSGKKGVELLEGLGIGTKEVGKGMLVFALVPEQTIVKFTTFITETFAALASQDLEKTEDGINVIDLMGNAIMNFSKSLALSAILLIPGMIAIPFLITSIAIMGLTMATIGGFSERIGDGADALNKVGDAILSFGIGLASFALVTFFILKKPELILGMVASLLIVGGAVALLGSKVMSKSIRKGAFNLMLIGVSLGIFAIGYTIFALAVKGTKLNDILIQGGVLIAIGGAMALAGLAVTLTGGGALLGPVLFALAGPGLLIFSLGYIPFAKATEGLKLNDILIQSGLLIGIAGVMALAGLAVALTAGAALLGPVLFGAAGGALLLLAPGLKAMKDLAYSQQDAKDLAITLGAVAMAFSGASPDDGPLATIGGMFRRVVESGVGLGAAAMYGAAGIALTDLSKGLADFKALGFTEEDSKELAVALSAVSSSFAQAGGEASNPGGLFGAIFGTAFTPNATKKGIKSIMGAGKALNDVVKGLAAFLDLKNNYGLTSEAFQPGGFLNVAITETLGFVQSAFAAIGSEGTTNAGGFWGSVFNIKKNVVQEGIDSVSGAGKALSGIVEGLAAFIDLKNSYGLTPESFQPGGFLNTAVVNSLSFVKSAFAAVGGEENVAAGGFFGSVFNISKNKVQEGIDSVSGAGKELTNIAMGLKTFQELVEKNVDFSAGGKLSTAVKNSLTFVGDAFASIGGKEESDSAFFGLIKWDENLVKKGIKAVKGAGAALTDIAEGLSSFADLSNPTALVTSISGLLKGISTVFAETYENDPRFSSHINDFRRLINDMGKRAADGDLEKAAADMQSMADAINSVDLVKAEAFGALFKGAADITDNGGRAALRALTDAVEEIRDLMSVSTTAAAETTATPVGSAATRSTAAETTATPAGGAATNATADQSGADTTALLNRINSTLSSLNSTMTNLPGSIAAIEIKLPND